ncbi:MAG: DMT family transporter [Muribaculaceae bacterium]|nr:DMT family transporter [Muribaculaceae bacterium]
MGKGLKIKGYVYGILAAAFYGMNPLFALPLYADGMSTSSVLLLRYLLAIPAVGVLLTYRGQNFRINRGIILPMIILGLLMGFSSFSLFESYNYMAAGIASTLLFVYPLLVAIIGTVVFRERLGLSTGLALCLAMCGIFLLYCGNPEGNLSLYGTILVMLSSLSYAIYIVWVNKGRVKKVPTLKVTFYVLLFGSSIFMAETIGKGTVEFPTTPLTWCSLAGLALLPTAASLIFTTLAIQEIGSTPAAILGVFEPLTALVIGIVVFHESVTLSDYSGMVLILTSVILVIGGNSIAKHLIHNKKMFPRKHQK